MLRATMVGLVALLLVGCAPALDEASAEPAPLPSISVPRSPSRSARATTVVPPPANAVFDYQIGGAYRPAGRVRIVSRDRTAAPVPGAYSICYLNAFQTQPEDRAFWTGEHPDLLVQVRGKPLPDPDWPGEFLLDTASAAKRAALLRIVGPWLDRCGRAGFAAIEPDNLDSWTRSGKRLSRAGNLAFASLLAGRAHARGLAVAQKNTAELTRAERTRVGFDFAIAEECQVYDECADYSHSYGNRVIEIEYTDNPRRFYTAACAARGSRISIILRDRDVLPRGSAGYRYEAC